MESNKKNEFLKIPIISHNSEKPSLIFEEMNSGKLYPSQKSTPKETEIKYQEKCISNINKKYIEIPIKSHESEKPSIAFEETTFKKLIPKAQTSIACENYQKTLKNRKNDKYAEIPIIAHDSQKPSICYEEDNNGKINSYIQDPMIFYNEEKENKNQKNEKESKLKTENKNINNEKDNKMDIVIHESQKPSIVYEEISSGIENKNFSKSGIPFNFDDEDIILKSEKKDKKYNKTEFIIHESQKPSMVFEEINGGIRYKDYPTSFNDLKNDKEINKNIQQPSTNLKCDKNENDEKDTKYGKIKIVVHNSEKPRIVFEEINTGLTYGHFPTINRVFGKEKDEKKINYDKKGNIRDKSEEEFEKSQNDFEEKDPGSKNLILELSINESKDDKKFKKEKKDKKFDKTEIIIHESQKPTMTFEEINSGLRYKPSPKTVNILKSDKEAEKIKSEKIEKCNNPEIIVQQSEKPLIKDKKSDKSEILSQQFEKPSKIEKIYNKIEIIITESEEPSIAFEEIDSGIRYKAYQTSTTNFKNDKHDKILKNKIKEKISNKPEIIVQDSEKKSNNFEEMNSENKNLSLKSPVINLKQDKKEKNEKQDKSNEKSKIIIQESEKPVIISEEINSDDKNLALNSSNTNLKNDIGPKRLRNKKKDKTINKENLKKEESEKSSINNEKINSDDKNLTLKSEETNLKSDKKYDKNEKNEKIDKLSEKTEIIIQEIIIQDSEKPPISNEEMNSGIKLKSSKKSINNLKRNKNKKKDIQEKNEENDKINTCKK